MTVVKITSGSTSSWISYTNPADSELDVSRTDDFQIVFTRIVDQACLVNASFRLLDSAGNEVVDPFLTIETNNDYSPVLQTLDLHINGALEASMQYMLVISGLYDAAGDSQDSVHTVQFITNDSVVDATPVAAEEDFVTVVDKTLSPNANLVETSGGTVGLFMDPVNHAYNVARDTNEVIFRFSPATGIDAAYVTVERSVISQMEVPWTTVIARTSETVTAGSMTIVMPQVSSGVYIEPGYEYRFTVECGTQTWTYYIMGELSPMLQSVQNVLLQNPSLGSYEAARMIYLNTAWVVSIDGAQATLPTRAGMEYVLYSTLFWSTRATGMTIVLGDLEVSKQGGESLDAKWERLMNDALRRLQKANPVFLIKGSANTSPIASRDWDATPSARRRTSGWIPGD